MKNQALTDPFLPKLKVVKALRPGRFYTKKLEAFLPLEDTAWLDSEDNVIYYAEAGCDITDFSSTPAGDGAKGFLRFAGRLHDLMCDETPVLIPEDELAVHKLIKSYDIQRRFNKYLNVEQIINLGWKRDRKKLSIWKAAKVYHDILVSLGFPKWRAVLHCIGLRMFQRFYRWWWANGYLEMADNPNWRKENGYFKN